MDVLFRVFKYLQLNNEQVSYHHFPKVVKVVSELISFFRIITVRILTFRNFNFCNFTVPRYYIEKEC